MLRFLLAALALVTATMAASARSARFKATDCGADESHEKCEEAFLKTSGPERRKAMIQELKRQQDKLNRMQSDAGVPPDAKADRKTERDGPSGE